MEAGLYVVPTPIGNLKDITIRAIDTLKSSHLILCEDSRVTRRLLQEYNIDIKLSVYNDYSDQSARSKILSLIKAGQIISLVSDAGTPLIADAGYKLIQDVREAGLYVDVLPGACSVITALCLSGMPTDKFIFLGFMPRKLNEQRSLLQKIINLEATLIFFESPKRLISSLHIINDVLGTRECSIVREVSKVYQEVIKGELLELIDKLKNQEIKGEIVLLVRKSSSCILDPDIFDKMRLLMLSGMSQSQASQILSILFNVPKNKIYSLTKKF